MLLIIYSFLFNFSFAQINEQGQLDLEFQTMVSALPDKALTERFIIERAMQNSDSYKEILSLKHKIGSFTDIASSSLEPKIYLKGQDISNKNEPSNPMIPIIKQDHRTYSFGGGKYFSSGTNLGFDVSRTKSLLGFGGAIPSSSGFYQTITTVSLTQNLLKDSFGNSTRAGLLSSKELEKLHQLSMIEAKENWSKDLMKLFYYGEFYQHRVLAIEQIVKSHEHLLNMTKIRLNRGTSEKSDVIQVEGSLKQALIQYEQAKQMLNDIWRNLITTLRFPEKWFSFNPIFVPIKTANFDHEATKICQNNNFNNSVASDYLKDDIRLLKSDSLKNSHQFSLEKNLNLKKPELQLFAQTASNSIDTKVNTTYSESRNWEHPAYTIGINFTLPLMFYAENAAISDSRTQYLKADAENMKIKSQIKVQWLNSCFELKRLLEQEKTLLSLKEEYHKRSTLEENRYQIGRINLYQLILAKDDFTNVEIQLKETQMNKKILSWNILGFTEDLRNFLETIENKISKEVK